MSQPVAAAEPAAAAAAQAVPNAAPSVSRNEFIASGPIVVENQVDVLAERGGVMVRILKDTGARVRRGDLLAELDSRQLTADVESATAKAASIDADLKNWEALVKVAEADRRRAEAMWENKLITQQTLDHERYKLVATRFEVDRERQNLRHSRAAARSLELELQKTRVRAPFNGVVARRYVREGQKVEANDRLFWVTATRPLRVRFTLPEAMLRQVRPGVEVEVVPVALETSVRARVAEVSPVVDPASGTVEVVADLLSPPDDVRPGMATNIRLVQKR